LRKDNLVYYFILFILVLIWVTFIKPIGVDESEHLHFSFLTGNGLIPFEDYWQHHLPLIWYLLSFVSLFSGFFYKLFAARIFQSIVWVFVVFLIDKYSDKNYSWIITLILVVAFPIYDYISIRPEFFALPLIIYVLNIFYFEIKPKMSFWLILSVVLSVFLTPRIYLFIFIFCIYIYYKNDIKFNLKFTLVLAFSFSIFFIFLFDFYDIIYFVFVQSREWSCNIVFNYFEYVTLAFHLLGFIICVKQKRFFIVLSYLGLFFTFYIEAAPYRNQSTLFLTITTIYIFSKTINLNKKYYVHIILVLISLLICKTILKYNINSSHTSYADFFHSKIFFKNDLVIYQNSYKSLNNKYFQTKGFNKKSNTINDLVHPIFIMNYSYFSFSQPCILENNYKSVIDYNLIRRRKINYFKSSEKLYYINPSTETLFNKIKVYNNKLK